MSSLRAHGFAIIVLIGDSGGNQQGLREVAETLNTRWAGSRTCVVYVPEYYDYPGVTRWLESQGIRELDEGHHDDFGITSQVMVIDPELVRMKERVVAGRFSINGVPLAPLEQTLEIARRLIDFRAQVTVDALRGSLP